MNNDERRRTVHAFFLTDDNAFQREQARAAQVAANRHGIALTIRYAESNALVQIHQLYESIHAKSGPVPDAIVVEPVAIEGMARAARNATAAGIGWVCIDADAEDVEAPRAAHPELPVFAVGLDNVAVGEVAAAQILRLSGDRRGASLLCVQGTHGSRTAAGRLQGLKDALASHDVSITGVDTNWTKSAAKVVVAEWLKLDPSKIDFVVGQNDAVAEGAREAIGEVLGHAERQRIGFIGCDGTVSEGQALVKSGVLAATIVVPPHSDVAVDAIAAFYAKGTVPPPKVVTKPTSFPPLEELG